MEADVLAIGPRGERVALEAQLVPMTAAGGEERTATYAADAIRTLWVTTKNTSWLYGIPGVKIGPSDHTTDVEEPALIVSRG